MTDETDFTKSEFKKREIELPLTKEITDELILKILKLPEDKKGLYRDSIHFLNTRGVETPEDKKFVEEWRGRDLDYGEIKKIKAFLIEDRKKFESLGCGFHNGVYYFGTKLFKNGNPSVAVITSDKKAYIKRSGNLRIATIF